MNKVELLKKVKNMINEGEEILAILEEDNIVQINTVEVSDSALVTLRIEALHEFITNVKTKQDDENEKLTKIQVLNHTEMDHKFENLNRRVVMLEAVNKKVTNIVNIVDNLFGKR